MATIVREQDVITKSPVSGATGKLAHGEGLTMATWHLKRDTRLAAHSHPHEQMTVVVSGSIQLVVEGTPHVLLSGEMAIIPGGETHEAQALEDSIIVDAFTPVREDLR